MSIAVGAGGACSAYVLALCNAIKHSVTQPMSLDIPFKRIILSAGRGICMTPIVKRFAMIVCLFMTVCAITHADEITLAKPITGEAYIKDGAGKAKAVRGALVKFDETSFTMRSNKVETQYAWVDCTPTSAVTLRQKAIDRKSASDWLALGEFAWNMGAPAQAKQAMKSAVQIDASLKERADAILASKPKPLERPVVKKENDAPGDNGDLIKSGNSPLSAAAATPGRIEYKPATREEAAEANTAARKRATDTAAKLGVDFKDFETDHFLVFTDWDKREFDFLKNNLEGAYTVVAKQFDMDPKGNVFVGKLPVFMFARYEDFARFAQKIDDFPGVNRQTAGYYMGNTNGFGHMAMWKPDESLTGTSSLADAKRLWGYVLVHEFTHAFLARYRSNAFVPRWLNEGIAEVIAAGQLPLQGRWTQARLIAMEGEDIGFIFNDDIRPTGRYYPVMQTMVEMLVSSNRKNFIKMIDSIKDGTEPDQALQMFFKLDHTQLEIAWRDYARRLTKN